MKKIYYLFAFIAVATALSACHPLDETYKKLGPVPAPTAPIPAPITVNLTLAPADYTLLPADNYAHTSLSFKTSDDAKEDIPTILSSKYPTASDKSTLNVIYANSPATITVADTLFTDVAYTLTDADYLLLPNNKYTDFSASQILSWLPYKYPTPLDNQLALLTFTYYESGVTSTATQSFLYLNGAWKKIYTISQAQYQSVGKGGTFNDFSAGDASNLPNYFNTFLKADAGVAATAKKYDIQYVSFKYFASKNWQRVIPVTFDGANWVTTPINVGSPLTFLKTDGMWVADNTVYYTATTADYKYIGTQTTAGSQSARDNVAQYGDFNISAATDATYWSDTDIQNAFIALLAHDFPTAVANQKFVVTYEAYNKGATVNVTKTFQYNGSVFVFVQ